MKTLKNLFIYKGFHRILSTRTSSRWFGKLASARIYPPVLRFFIRLYVRAFTIDLSQFDFDYRTVTTFNAFFTRRLLPGMRKWEDGICSPVDGRMLSFGAIMNDTLFQVKGMDFKLSDLVGQDTFKEGSFVNMYLSPADYHRVHAPFNMMVKSVSYIPGRLLSVSRKNAMEVSGLYSGNERVVLSGDSEYGRFHFVLVGALFVGSIGLVHFPNFTSNRKVPKPDRLDIEINIDKGDELGWFEMGSTVLILLETDALKDANFLDQSIKLGTRLA